MEPFTDLSGDGALEILIGLRRHHLHKSRIGEEVVDVPPLDGVRPLHDRQVSLYPHEATGAPGGASVSVIAPLEADGSEGADLYVPVGLEPEDDGVDAFFHRNYL